MITHFERGSLYQITQVGPVYSHEPLQSGNPSWAGQRRGCDTGRVGDPGGEGLSLPPLALNMEEGGHEPLGAVQGKEMDSSWSLQKGV